VCGESNEGLARTPPSIGHLETSEEACAPQAGRRTRLGPHSRDFLRTSTLAVAALGLAAVTVATETEKKLTFVLEAGQVRHVRLKIQMGIVVGRIVPELVDRAEAEGELKDLSHIVQPLN